MSEPIRKPERPSGEKIEVTDMATGPPNLPDAAGKAGIPAPGEGAGP